MRALYLAAGVTDIYATWWQKERRITIPMLRRNIRSLTSGVVKG